MEKRIDYTQPGGFPLTQDVLGFMQAAYSNAIAALARLLGDGTVNVIVHGCESNGTDISDGFVCIGGELLPFTGGKGTVTNVLVEETKGRLVFEDLQQKEVLITRRARLDASGTLPFVEFARMENWLELKGRITSLAYQLEGVQRLLRGEISALRGEIAEKITTGTLEVIDAIGMFSGGKLKGYFAGDRLELESDAGSDRYKIRMFGDSLEMLKNDIHFLVAGKDYGIRFYNGKVNFLNVNNVMRMILTDIPTSAAGLPEGCVWRDGNTLKIV